MGDEFIMRPVDPSAPALDSVALSRLFSLGDSALREALHAQLRDDFVRIDRVLGGECAQSVARAAHEMKGLAATVGAWRLADIATIVDKRGPMMGEAARGLILAQLRSEIAQVLAELDRAAQAEAGT